MKTTSMAACTRPCNKNAHLISVVIPIFNTGNFLKEALMSVLNQRLLGDVWSLEVLLIDDGSTDTETIKICRSFTTQYPHLFQYYSFPNKGVASARNSGIDNAKGDFIFFLDSDDVLTPNCLSTLCYAQEQSGADIIVGNYRYMSETLGDEGLNGWKGLSISADFISPREAIALTHDKNDGLRWVVPWNKLIRASLLKKHRFPPNLFLFEDEATLPFLYHEASKICPVAIVTYYYRLNGNGLSRSRSKYLVSAYQGSRLLIDFYFQNRYSFEVSYWVWNAYVFLSGALCKKLIPKKMVHSEKKSFRRVITRNKILYLPWTKRVFLWVFRFFGISLYCVLGLHRRTL